MCMLKMFRKILNISLKHYNWVPQRSVVVITIFFHITALKMLSRTIPIGKSSTKSLKVGHEAACIIQNTNFHFKVYKRLPLLAEFSRQYHNNLFSTFILI